MIKRKILQFEKGKHSNLSLKIEKWQEKKKNKNKTKTTV